MVFVITYKANQQFLIKKIKNKKSKSKSNFFFICLLLFTKYSRTSLTNTHHNIAIISNSAIMSNSFLSQNLCGNVAHPYFLAASHHYHHLIPPFTHPSSFCSRNGRTRPALPSTGCCLSLSVV
jgi:hypothetical protein